LHYNGIYHGDYHLSNILVRQKKKIYGDKRLLNWSIKVIDFGRSSIIDEKDVVNYRHSIKSGNFDIDNELKYYELKNDDLYKWIKLKYEDINIKMYMKILRAIYFEE
jgi:serine/threonine protein kinase